jgi:hypothetical protein
MLEKYGLIKKQVSLLIFDEFQWLNQQQVVSFGLEFLYLLEASPSFELKFSEFESY